MPILHISNGTWIDNAKIRMHLNFKTSRKVYLITNTQQLMLTPTFAQISILKWFQGSCGLYHSKRNTFD
jgi:hypothetical protein